MDVNHSDALSKASPQKSPEKSKFSGQIAGWPVRSGGVASAISDIGTITQKTRQLKD